MFAGSYTAAVDAWSLGVNLYLFLSGRVPFGMEARDDQQIYASIRKDALDLTGREWDAVSPAAKELLMGLLEKEPTKRYSLAQAIAHPWVSGDAAPDVALNREILASLVSFNAKNRFKKAALKLVASTLGAPEVAKLRAEFLKLDTDHSGFISYDEMRAALKGITADPSKLAAVVANVDDDGDGRISYEEFMNAALSQQLALHQNAIWWAFCEYDKDGDGRITASELKSVLVGESDEKISKYIAEFDTDGNGSIDYGAGVPRVGFVRPQHPLTLPPAPHPLPTRRGVHADARPRHRRQAR
jgi:calcium-dependent protein kinase